MKGQLLITAKVTIMKNDDGMWEIGTVTPLEDGELLYQNRHETSTWADAAKWVEAHYVN